MALSSSNAAKQLSDGNSQGTSLGQSTADKISFYNASPLAQLNVNGLSISSGALSSSLAFQLNRLGLINCTTFAA